MWKQHLVLNRIFYWQNIERIFTDRWQTFFVGKCEVSIYNLKSLWLYNISIKVENPGMTRNVTGGQILQFQWIENVSDGSFNPNKCRKFNRKHCKRWKWFMEMDPDLVAVFPVNPLFIAFTMKIWFHWQIAFTFEVYFFHYCN